MENLKLLMKTFWIVALILSFALTIGALIFSDVNVLRTVVPVMIISIPTVIVLINNDKKI